MKGYKKMMNKLKRKSKELTNLRKQNKKGYQERRVKKGRKQKLKKLKMKEKIKEQVGIDNEQGIYISAFLHTHGDILTLYGVWI